MPVGPGLANAPHFSLAYRDIAAVVSHLSEAEVIPTQENLWQHEEVVEALMTDYAVLPARFGTILPDEPAVQAVLAGRYADFVANLDRVRGRVEVGLRVIWPDTPPIPPFKGGDRGSGRSYLLARLEQERQAQARHREAETLAAELDDQLVGLAVERIHQVLVTPHLLLTAAYLLERDRLITFRQAVEKLSPAYPSLCFLCTGPWPAYNFVTTTAPIGIS